MANIFSLKLIFGQGFGLHDSCQHGQQIKGGDASRYNVLYCQQFA